jgi:replicative DNA helicase
MRNYEAERAVLSAMMRNNRCIAEVVPILKEADFTQDAHHRVWRSILSLSEQGEPADVMTVCDHLKQCGQIDDLGHDGRGYEYLSELFDFTGCTANVTCYAKLVREEALRRELWYAGREIVQEAESHATPAEQLIEMAEQRIFALSRDCITDDELDAQEVVGEVYQRIDARVLRARNGGRIADGISTGFLSLNVLLGGLQRSEFTVLAAKPGIGKTTLALEMAVRAALEQEPVLFVSLEQSRAELFERAKCNLADVDGQRLRQGLLTDEQNGRIHAAGERLRQAKLRVSDAPTQRLLKIASRARREKQKGRLSLLVIDYLQLIEPDPGKEPRHEKVAAISRKLKHLARELAVPVLAVAQLNRESEQRADQRPRLSDLRESGAIEADCSAPLR